MLVETFLKRLRENLGKKVLTDVGECRAYSYDNSPYRAMPSAVIFAEKEQDVIDSVKICYEFGVPITARGRGSNTTGASIPCDKGVILSFERMYQIKNFDKANRSITVEPGIANQTVQDFVGKYGLFWAPDPSSAAYATVGGNIACCAAGPHAIKYGTTRENVLHLRGVTGESKVIETGYYTPKGCVGYDLTRLLIGSEGTLAIITEATLKLLPRAETKATFRAFYHSIEACTQAVTNLMSTPLVPSALEFMDDIALNLIRAHTNLSVPTEACALLIIEIDGLKKNIQAASAEIMMQAQNSGCINITKAESEIQRKELWETRKALSPTLKHAAPNKINEDVVVPVTQLPEFINRIKELSRQYDITIVNFGHAGSGNIHVNLMFDENDPTQRKNSALCLKEIFESVLACRGTLSGEHGVGLAKKPFITAEIHPNTLTLMKAIKKQFDPKNILNPGKIFD